MEKYLHTLTEKQKLYIEVMASGVSLTPEEEKELFGNHDYQQNLTIKRELLDRKTKLAINKKLREVQKSEPWPFEKWKACKEKMIEIALNDKHPKQFDALKFICGSKAAYDNAIAQIQAEKDLDSGSSNQTKRVYEYHNIKDKPS